MPSLGDSVRDLASQSAIRSAQPTIPTIPTSSPPPLGALPYAHGQKRCPPDTTTSSFESQNPAVKKQRLVETPNKEPGVGSISALPQSPALLTENRSRSPNPVFLDAAATMLSRPEDSGGNRTIKLTRGVPGNSAQMRSSPRPSSHQGSESGHLTKILDNKITSGTQTLNSVGLSEFMQQDDRPIFVIDIGDDVPMDELQIIFANLALRMRPSLFDCVQGKSEDAALLLDLGTPFVDFKTWVLGSAQAQDITPLFPFAGVVWKSSTVRKRLRIVTGQSDQITIPIDVASGGTHGNRPGLQAYNGLGSSSSAGGLRKYGSDQGSYFDVIPTRKKATTPGNLESLVISSFPSDSPSSEPEDFSISPSGTISPPSEAARSLFPLRSNPENLESMSMNYLSDRGFYDWTRLPLSPSLPAHIRFARSVEWEKTSLGPISEWSSDLRGMCNLIMASPHPAAMYWGSDHVAIYNEAYIMLAGQKHPHLMGSKYSVAWAEIWDALEGVFAMAMNTAQATMKDDDCLFMERNGYLEETYFSWSIIPLIGDDGSVVGLYNPAFEKTRRKIAERRMLTLREIGERTAAARAISHFWSLLIEGFQYNEYDAPLVIIYSLSDTDDSDAASSASSTAAALKQCHLEGALGVTAGHPAAPEFIDLKYDVKGFGSVFKQAINAEKPIVLSTEKGTLDTSLLEGIQWRGFGDPSRVVVVSPIRPTTGESTLGFLVMGTNPRRPYDEDYDLFVQLLGRQLATSIASVVLFEEEIRKGEKAARMAAQDRIELSNQLAARTQEAVESENKFTRMAELAPVGMYIGDAEGKLTFANDAWYSISSYPQDTPIGNKWFKYIREEDEAAARKSWSTMLIKKCPITFEFRFKTVPRDKNSSQTETWVLASASPEKDDDGKITRVFGSVTNISSQKFAEALQRKRMEEAVEMKRQQERYIDTTSHEMRNPLSAILQSADSITASLAEMKSIKALSADDIEAIDTVIESSQTITLCAQHQKRIVDDVLTLSKLDSAMLLVTPIDVQPASIAQRAVKMFEGELQTADIALDVRIDTSYSNLGVDWVRLDPTRLSQVIINLMTNAIKFTTTQEKRVIRMHLAASKEKPSQEDKYRLTYIPSQAPKDKDPTAGAEWGLGEPVYIHFAVQDTGRGLNESERKQLFQRFSQANPRTHVTYGGSGLGLFISRELVELQGGEIGVASESGKGSTFAFYVKARRSQAPADGSEDDAEGFHSWKGPKTVQKPSRLKGQLPISGLPTSPLESSSGAAARALKKSKSDASGLRVLIVEDNLINQKVLAAQLKKLGCIVSVANHGGEAIDQLQKSKFHRDHIDDGNEIDVVLMDLEMPVMDGQTCARELRRMQAEGEIVRHIPVIAVTANAREQQILETLESGIDDVVSKPFRIPVLVPKMRDVIARFATPQHAGKELETMAGIPGQDSGG